MPKEYKPKILAFACNWGSYAGADLAGAAGMSYPTDVRIVRLLCSARVDPAFVVEAFMDGADGTLLAACHPNFCHYVDGSIHAETRVKFLKKLLNEAGFDPARLRLAWISASEGAQFAEVIEDFVQQLKTIGPSPLSRKKPDPELQARMEAVKVSAEDFRLRTLIGKERKLVEEGNVYDEKKPQEEVDELMGNTIGDEYIRNRIYLLVKDEPLSVKGLAKRLDLDPQRVLRHIVVMRRKGLIALDKIEGTSPLYKALEVI